MKTSILLTVFTAVLACTGALNAAVYLVPDDRDMIADADAIVIATVGYNPHGVFGRNGDIFTARSFELESVLKGNINPSSTIEIRDLGGVVGDSAMGVSDDLRYEPGERVLLFLTRDDEGHWRTWGMSLGKFNFVNDAGGRKLIVRGMKSEIFGFDAGSGRRHVERARAAAAFLTYIRDQVGAQRRVTEPAYFVDQPATTHSESLRGDAHGGTITAMHHVAASAYTQGNFRWTAFAAGQSAPFYVSGSQPGYDSSGAAQRGVNAWTNDPNSTVRYTIGGTTSAKFVQDSQNTIVFNSSTDVPAGAIGFSKWYASGQHTFDNQQWYTTTEGDAVMRSGLSISQSAFDEAVTHELGHTLGFRHSNEGTPSSSQAVMNSVVNGNFGASLQAWDRDAVNHVYGDGSLVGGGPPGGSCTAPAITQQPTSRTITAGQSTTLSVTATGTAPLTYQWYTGNSSSNTPIPGSNNSSITVVPSTTTSYFVNVSNACGVFSSQVITVTVNPAPRPVRRQRSDFNSDGFSDILWRNRVTGANRLWFMANGGSVLAVANLTPWVELNWTIVGADDFTGDLAPDICWWNRVTGEVRIWIMSGVDVANVAYVTTVSDTQWRPSSVNDFNHDGYADIIWRHYGTGANTVWYLQGTQLLSSASLTTAPDLRWTMVGSADANADGYEDIFWRHTTGSNAIWLMTNTTLTRSTGIFPVNDMQWQIGALGTFSAGGMADMIWRHYTAGADNIWFIRNGAVQNTGTTGGDSNTTWEIVGPR